MFPYSSNPYLFSPFPDDSESEFLTPEDAKVLGDLLQGNTIQLSN